jgi:hypothetical protein
MMISDFGFRISEFPVRIGNTVRLTTQNSELKTQNSKSGALVS